MSQEHLTKIVDVLRDLTSDWDLEMDGDIGSDTRLIADLAFESIDIVEMVVAIEQAFQKRGIPFEGLLMVDGRYVDDLSVGQVADFVAQHV
jgi:acyl carrier protein